MSLSTINTGLGFINTINAHIALASTKWCTILHKTAAKLVHKRRFFFLLGSLSTLLLSSTLFFHNLKNKLLLTRNKKALRDRRKAFTRSLYKIELHCHLTGSLRLSTLNELLKSHNLPPYTPPPTLTLKSCFTAFPHIHSAIKTVQNLSRVTFECLADLSYANVIYAEIRTTPRALLNSTKSEYIETVLSCFSEWSLGDSKLLPRLIISVDRSKPVSEAYENVKIAVEKFNHPSNKCLVGIDLGGDPTKGSFIDFLPVLTLARTSGLKITVHCGEIINPSEIDEILNFRPDRLGHFLTCTDEQFERARDNEIPIEVCPTSNLLTLGLNSDSVSLKTRHGTLRKCIETAASFSISTDDPGLFRTNPVRELWSVSKAFELDEWRIAGVVWDMVDQVFEGNRKTRAYLARDVRVRIKKMLRVLEEEGGTEK
ncbi:hypothetical protein TrST_g13765 [Triparma strigata]|uniref:Adenosine deaminase n=1 Tax=Triparma strigata TaxID=1606541 RepID=A0A9W7E1E8_9STRA|nr:hypothetical protein TrST_g13765 [Triparma strigata]